MRQANSCRLGRRIASINTPGASKYQSSVSIAPITRGNVGRSDHVSGNGANSPTSSARGRYAAISVAFLGAISPSTIDPAPASRPELMKWARTRDTLSKTRSTDARIFGDSSQMRGGPCQRQPLNWKLILLRAPSPIETAELPEGTSTAHESETPTITKSLAIEESCAADLDNSASASAASQIAENAAA